MWKLEYVEIKKRVIDGEVKCCTFESLQSAYWWTRERDDIYLISIVRVEDDLNDISK